MATKTKSPKRFALYWCTTPDGDEDWFVVADSAREARRFHEDEEGFNRGDASAERIMALPLELVVEAGWRDGPGGELRHEAGWPSDAFLTACGAQIAKQPRDGLRDMMGVVAKDVLLVGRHFRSGDVVTNVQRARGVKESRLGVFKGGKDR